MSETFFSLARKWRPQRLADMVGQAYIVRSLQNAVVQQRVHHAYLFSGTRGVGKTTLARIMAMLMNCEQAQQGSNSEPCHECNTCKLILEGRLTDVLELDAASHTQVDKMRELLESAVYAPVQARYKIFIIDEVHMLSKPSFNAMLKTLEEPPSHVKFILATTDPQKIPATIRSRCLCFSLLPLTIDQIDSRLAHILKQENIPFEPAAARLIARLANGSLRDGLSILDQAISHRDGTLTENDVRQMTGDTDNNLLVELLTALADSDAEKIRSISQHHQQHNVDYDHTLTRMANLIYKTAFCNAVPNTQFEDEKDNAIAKDMAQRFSAESLQVLYEIAIRGRQQLPLAPDLATGFEMTLLRMMLFAPQAAPAAPSNPPTSSFSQAQSAPRESKAGGIKQPAHSAAMQAPAETKPAAAPTEPEPSTPPAPQPTESAAPRPPLPHTNDDWQRLAAQLSESAKAIALNCTLEACDKQHIRLLLDKSFSSCLQFQPQLEKELRQLFGSDFGVQIAQSEADEAAAQIQEKAVRIAKAAPFINDILTTIDQARLVPERIKLTEKGEML